MITKETESTKTFYWKSLDCELCKSAFPNLVKMAPSMENSSQEHGIISSVLSGNDISLHVVKFEKPE